MHACTYVYIPAATQVRQLRTFILAYSCTTMHVVCTYVHSWSKLYVYMVVNSRVQGQWSMKHMTGTIGWNTPLNRTIPLLL